MKDCSNCKHRAKKPFEQPCACGCIFKSTVVMGLYMCIQLLETENDKELILTLIYALSREELECGKENAVPPANQEDKILWPFPDAVPVVRCKDCHWCKKHPTSDKVNVCTNESWNTEYYTLVTDDDFCSNGERRKHD